MNDIFDILKKYEVCSCIRKWNEIIEDNELSLVDENLNPKPGDIVIVSVVDDKYGYEYLENNFARNVRLFSGSVFVGVLGNRNSGTNIFGKVPKTPIKKGDVIDLLSQGGLIGECISVDNKQRFGKAMPVRVEAFLKNADDVANIMKYSKSHNEIQNITKERGKIAVFFGTSAEVGKTTLLRNSIRWLRENKKDKNIIAFKACGTGRMKDKMNYVDAGASYSFDFVDYGFSSTYDLGENEFYEMIKDAITYGTESGDYFLIEVGGDLLEANADLVVKIIHTIDAKICLCVNDAIGAIYGRKLLEEKGNINIISFKQNIYSLKEKLKLQTVFDSSYESDIDKLCNILFN